MNFSNTISILLGIPKSIFINFKYFPIKIAMRLPILVSKNTLIKGVNGKITLPKNIKTGIIRFGFGNIGIFDSERSKSIWQVNGEAIFEGRANIGHGSRLSINSNGKIKIGKNLDISAESTIICSNYISIGNDCLISWECLIMDTDFHYIKNENGEILNRDKAINIGNNVWIACRNTILKGSSISNNTVVAANSTIYNEIKGENQIIGGNPCKILRNNTFWNK